MNFVLNHFHLLTFLYDYMYFKIASVSIVYWVVSALVLYYGYRILGPSAFFCLFFFYEWNLVWFFLD